MTNVERTNIETYLSNINNLIALKKALEQSLTYTQHELWMAIGGFEDYDDENLKRKLVRVWIKNRNQI